MYKYDNIDLELLRESFLVKNERIFLEEMENNEKFRKYTSDIMNILKKYSINELKKILIEKVNKVENGEIKEKELEKIEYEIALILSIIPNNIEEADKYWSKKFNESKEIGDKNKVLIEIAAQHPLIDGKPGIEFEQRLKKGIDLYKKEKQKGNSVTIYIPGSLHSVKKGEEWVSDPVPLSEAGKQFLINNGIPQEDIRANDENKKYKENGVYNSADECFVSCAIAKNENCGRIISVVSPTQVYRKALLYNQFGYKPEIYGSMQKKEYHNYVKEAFWSLFITYAKDHTWQEGFLKEKTRQERNINYQVNEEIEQILNEGIVIPESVKLQKEKWLQKYNIAEMQTKEKDGNKKTLIDLSYNDLNEDLVNAVKDIMENCEKENLVIYSKDQKQIDFIKNEFEINDEQFVYCKDKEKDSVEYMSNEFNKKTNNFKEFFEILPSSKSMNLYMKYIDKGIMPYIISIPEEKENYNDEIKEMYKNLIYRENEIVPNIEEER